MQQFLSLSLLCALYARNSSVYLTLSVSDALAFSMDASFNASTAANSGDFPLRAKPVVLIDGAAVDVLAAVVDEVVAVVLLTVDGAVTMASDASALGSFVFSVTAGLVPESSLLLGGKEHVVISVGTVNGACPSAEEFMVATVVVVEVATIAVVVPPEAAVVIFATGTLVAALVTVGGMGDDACVDDFSPFTESLAVLWFCKTIFWGKV